MNAVRFARDIGQAGRARRDLNSRPPNSPGRLAVARCSTARLNAETLELFDQKFNSDSRCGRKRVAHASQVMRAERAAVIGLSAVCQRYLNDVRPVAVFFGP